MSALKPNLLTPFALARAMILPFIWIPGGMALMLGLAASTIGLDPAEFIADFLADSAIVLSPLALKCAGIWAGYTAIYFIATWAHRPSLIPFSEFDEPHPALCRLIGDSDSRLRRIIASALSYWLVLLEQSFFWRGVGLSWSPGVHPQLE